MVTAASEEVVVVWLGGKQFALPVGAVREVVQVVQPTAMPSWPDSVLGIIEIRGELLPLFDMSALVGQSAVSISKSQFIVVFFAQERSWGLLVDVVDGVKTLTLRLRRATAASSAVDRGLVSDPTFTAVLLDPEALVAALGLDADLLTIAAP